MKTPEAWKDAMAVKLDDRAKEYALNVFTLANGVKVQRTPSGNDLGSVPPYGVIPSLTTIII